MVLSIVTADIPTVQPVYRLERTDLGNGFERGVLRFGFMDEPDVAEALRYEDGLGDGVVYFLGAEAIVVTDEPGMAPWRERLYALLHRNTTPASAYFRLPDDRTVSVGIRVPM